MCSGQHAAMILLSRLRGWALDFVLARRDPAQVEYRSR